MKNVRGQEGFSFLEVIIAGLIFGIVMMALISGMNFVGLNQRRIQELTAEDRTVSSIINNIRANLQLYQLIYDADGTTKGDQKREELLAEPLPLAFNDTVLLPRDECLSCKGRLGVVIQPSRGLNSLYVVTIRIAHEELYPNGAKDFRFLAAYK